MAFAIFCCDPERRAAVQGSDEEMPEGARSWNARAKRLQQRILQRWGLASAPMAELAAPSASATPGAIAPSSLARP